MEKIITMTESDLKKMAIDFALSSERIKEMAETSPEIFLAAAALALDFVNFLVGNDEIKY